MINTLKYLYQLVSEGALSESAISRMTGISRSTLYDYKKGFYNPSGERVDLLNKAYQNIGYSTLRSLGMPVITAKSYAMSPPNTWDNIASAVNISAESIANKNKISREIVLLNMSKSQVNPDEWKDDSATQRLEILRWYDEDSGEEF